MAGDIAGRCTTLKISILSVLPVFSWCPVDTKKTTLLYGERKMVIMTSLLIFCQSAFLIRAQHEKGRGRSLRYERSREREVIYEEDSKTNIPLSVWVVRVEQRCRLFFFLSPVCLWSPGSVLRPATQQQGVLTSGSLPSTFRYLESPSSENQKWWTSWAKWVSFLPYMDISIWDKPKYLLAISAEAKICCP